MTLTTFMVRKLFKKGDTKRDAGNTIPEDVERWENICYGEDKKWNVMDVYRPKKTTTKLPVIVSVHGGGWCYGDKELYQWYCMNIAQRGFAVVNFTYRLAPEFKFPSGIEDTCNVFDWILKNDEWFDLDNVFAVGDSAGAHMLTIYSALCNSEEYAKRLGVTAPRKADGSVFVPKAVGLNCGVYEINFEKDPNPMTKNLMKALLHNVNDPAEMELVNPISFINDKFPTAFIMTANSDQLAGPPAQEVIVNKLEELGVKYIDKTYGSEEEPLNHVFHCDIKSAAAKQLNDDECEFFRSFISV